MKDLYIIRGLPGAGKTTFAKKIAEVVLEADMFFMDRDGNYQYDREKIADAHSWCQMNVETYMVNGYTSIAVANTFVKRWEMDVYYRMAKTWGYTVTEVTVTGSFPNLHGVPAEKIELMRQFWEV